MAVTIQLDVKQRIDAVGLRRFGARALKMIGLEGDVAILVTTDRRMRELNRWYGQKNYATDVLSFPGTPKLDHAGDIAITAEIAARNARKLGHSLADELKVLILHGMLHLGGYDHEADTGEMAGLEDHIRSRLGLPNALIKRTLAKKTKRTLDKKSGKKPSTRRKPVKIGRARAVATGRRKHPRGRSATTTK
ncbi:MAG: rRNA maturation RNase YbeY [Terriglobales bacterium]